MISTIVKLKLAILASSLKSAKSRSGFIVSIIVAIIVAFYYGTIFNVYSDLPTSSSAVLLTIVGSALIGMWWILPATMTGVDATLDPRKFAHYAISPRKLTAAFFAASFTTIPAALTLIIMLLPMLSWSPLSPGFYIALLGGVLGSTLAISGARAVTGLLSKYVRNKKVQIISYAVIVMLFVAFNLASAQFSKGIEMGTMDPNVILASVVDKLSPATQILQFTPFGAPFSLPYSAAEGSWAIVLVKVLVCVVTIIFLILVWEMSVKRELINPPGSDVGFKKTKPAINAGQKLGVFGRVPDSKVGAQFAKELVYWHSDPRYLSGAIGAVIMIFALGFSFTSTGLPIGLLAIPLAVIWMIGYIEMSYLNFDGKAFTSLLIIGVNGKAERLGRALFPLIAGGILAVVLSVVFGIISGLPQYIFPTITVAFGELLCVLGLSTFSGPFAIMPVPKSDKPFTSPRGKMGKQLAYSLGVLVGGIILSSPIIFIWLGAVGLFVNLFTLPQVLWTALAILIPLIWGPLIFAISVRLGGKALENRQFKIKKQMDKYSSL
jgi:ABC-2 type transport system permease protein